MNWLIFVRHGEPWKDDHLSPPGKLKMLAQAKKLEDYLASLSGEISVARLCSPARRARESMAIISEQLGWEGEPEISPLLDSRGLINPGEVFQWLRDWSEFDVGLIVSHALLAETMLNYFLQVKPEVRDELQYGDILIIDFGNHSHQYIR